MTKLVNTKQEGKCSISVLHWGEAARKESPMSWTVGADKETYMQQQETKKKEEEEDEIGK